LKGALSSILAKVQAGAEAVITSHRKPIAKIVPIQQVPIQPSQAVKTAAQDDDYYDTSHLPTIPGVVWRNKKFKLDPNFVPFKLIGEGPTVSEILIMQRRGEYVG
jgi:antitoxin (DNA-binding transcriptional repressor) of toxin-antitoxin stability system